MKTTLNISEIYLVTIKESKYVFYHVYKKEAVVVMIYLVMIKESKYVFYDEYKEGMIVIVWQLDLQLPVQSVPVTTKIVSSNPAHGEYAIKFVSD